MRGFTALFAALAFGFSTGCDGCRESGRAQDAGGLDANLPALFPASAATGLPTAPNPAPEPLNSAEVQPIVNPAGLPPYAGPTGSLEGTVYVDGDEAPEVTTDFSRCPAGKSVHGALFRTEVGAKGRALLDAVVGVTGYKAAYLPAPREAVRVEIKDCSLNQRTFVLTFGQALDVYNREDPKPDRFYALDLTRSRSVALMIAAPRGEPTHLYPKHVGRDILSDKMDRKYLSADVFVARQPLNAVSGHAGRYRIDGVPVGDLRVSAFHPGFVNAARPATNPDAGPDGMGEAVSIRAGEVTTRDFTLLYRYAPDDGGRK